MNNKRISKGWLATIIIVAVILIDQALKIWVKTSFTMHEDLEITSWFHLVFIENNGMAFGMEIGSKIFLTLFRIIAVALLIFYLVKLSKKQNVPMGYVACISLITAGALGNVLDCIFYGVIFDAPMNGLAQMFPAGGGYETLFNGRVVDMFYFPLWTWPDSFPLVGGHVFFEPVFNFADACLTTSVLALILFYAKYLAGDEKEAKAETEKAKSEEETAEKEKNS